MKITLRIPHVPESYFSLKISDQKDILQTAADELGRTPAVLEKDIWVCWGLEALFAMPDAHPMAFKGGTSLSKVYGVINRFSEDIDITLDYRAFGDETDPFAVGISSNQIRKFSDRLKGYVNNYAVHQVIPYLEEQLIQLPTAGQHEVRVDDNGEKIWVSYPSAVESGDEYLKTEILIELGGRNIIDPNEVHNITADVTAVTQDVEYPACEITVLSPERTFWEKATLVHVECNRGALKENADRLSRHWYDLTMLAAHGIGKSAAQNRGLLEDVIKHKKVFFNSRYADYDACLNNGLRLLPDDDVLDQLRADYENMIRAGMMYEIAPSFDEIRASMTSLSQNINMT